MLGSFFSLISDPAEKQGFEKIYLSYINEMYNTAYGILKNKSDAEDAVSEAFMSITNKSHLLKAGACPRVHAYLIIAAKNEAEKIQKQIKQVKKYDGKIELIRDKFSLDDIIDAKATAEELEELLLKLSDRYFEVLCLRIYMELNTHEIAELLGIEYENAKKRLQRAKKKLKELIKKSKKF